VSGVVENFLAAMVANDWEAMGACVADNVVRVGPFGDTYRGRADYVAFISELLPTLPGYRMDVERVVYADGGRIATAELSETVDVDGAPLRTPESLVFDLDDGGRIGHLAIYIQRLDGQ
jgi:ketosteroid isomerase-like protein